MTRIILGFPFHLMFYAMQRCLMGSLPVMKSGVFNTIRKQNDKFITNMDHPPYSPDFVPCDVWLLPNLKDAIKGQKVSDISDIQRKVKTLLQGIRENHFQDCFRQWHHHLTKCTASKGRHFEGESSR